MGEAKHLATAAAGGKRWWLVLGGAAGAVVAGVLLMQSWRAQPGQAATEPAGQKAPAKALARVGKDTIPYDLVAAECVTRHGKEVLDDLINRMIIQQACEANNLVVTEEDVTAEVNRIAKRFNLDPQGWYAMLQAERNLSPQQYRQSVIWPMLALRKLAGEQVDITEEDLNKAFVRNYGPRVKAKMILLDRLNQAQECWEAVNKAPAEFEQLAQKYSVDANSRSLGGAVPPIPRFSGSDELEKAAFKLKEGEISGIVQMASNRYAIIKCEGRTEPIVTDIEEVKDGLYDEIKEAKIQQSVAQVFEKLKKETRVDNYLSATSSGPQDRSVISGSNIQQTGATQAAPIRRAANTGRATLDN